MILNLLHPSNLIPHASHTKHLTESAPITSRSLTNRNLHVDTIPCPIFLFDQFHMRPIPMIADEAGDEEFGADAVGFGEREGVVNE